MFILWLIPNPPEFFDACSAAVPLSDSSCCLDLDSKQRLRSPKCWASWWDVTWVTSHGGEPRRPAMEVLTERPAMPILGLIWSERCGHDEGWWVLVIVSVINWWFHDGWWSCLGPFVLLLLVQKCFLSANSASRVFWPVVWWFFMVTIGHKPLVTVMLIVLSIGCLLMVNDVL